MRNSNHISNPKTIRRREQDRLIYEEQLKFANENGYKVFSKYSNTYTVSKDGIDSVLGFDTKAEVFQFIFDVSPDPKKIFPPYKLEAYIIR